MWKEDGGASDRKRRNRRTTRKRKINKDWEEEEAETDLTPNLPSPAPLLRPAPRCPNSGLIPLGTLFSHFPNLRYRRQDLPWGHTSRHIFFLFVPFLYFAFCYLSVLLLLFRFLASLRAFNLSRFLFSLRYFSSFRFLFSAAQPSFFFFWFPSLSVSVSRSLTALVCGWVNVCLYIWVCVRLYMCVCICMNIYLCVCVYLYMCVCESICTCEYVCLDMCVCASARVFPLLTLRVSRKWHTQGFPSMREVTLHPSMCVFFLLNYLYLSVSHYDLKSSRGFRSMYIFAFTSICISIYTYSRRTIPTP